MEMTIEYQNGIYTGEVKDGLPHGNGTLKIDDSETFVGSWKEGKRHGAGHHSRISRHDYDGLETALVYHQYGIWTDDVLSGVVWEYRYEEDMSEKTTESCIFQDEYGLVLLGIDRKGKLIGKFEPTKVSDCIEVLNHFLCVDHIIDHTMDPIDIKLIRRLHYLLMYGSVDARLKRVSPGEFRTAMLEQKNRTAVPASEISDALKEIIGEYESIQRPELMDILNLHVQFEKIAPFRDGNGRVGRLLIFKECLRYGIAPFILHDKKRSIYLEGIKKWDNFKTRKTLLDLASDEQEDFAKIVALCKVKAYTPYYQLENDMQVIE